MKIPGKFQLIGLLLVLLFLSFPVQMYAQVKSEVAGEEAYRAVLFQLIETLQKQILSLQNQIDRQSEKNEEEVKGLKGVVDIEAVYRVDDVEDLEKIRTKEHKEYFKRVFDIFPDNYDNKLRELIVFAGDGNEFDAFVETLPPTHTSWLYAVSSEVFDIEDSLPNTELIVHELGHIVSYEEDINIPQSRSYECDPYFDIRGCPAENSYLNQFAEKFWSPSDLTRASRYATKENTSEEVLVYYKKHKNEYVSDYATYNPEEDFAESFTFFVLGKVLLKGSVAREKVDFFSDYEELENIQKEIGTRL
ncbi:hypothetical protein KC865_05035 [Candidatus Kaiserbacteria bacterium]|nr:hypothetical protein [Candidatus Kaiserbacteria bacterium]USN92623.1 MAG: hypothetical protein H6782_02315 [Candidatus Nomurabacteria bacterium]